MLKITRNGRLEYWYYRKEHKISIPKHKINTKHKLFLVLHELGHAFYKHSQYDQNKNRISKEQVIQQELEAWDYAFSCIKQSQFLCMLRVSSKSINHYVSPDEWFYYKLED